MRPVPDPIVSHVTRIMTELTALKRTTGLILAVSGGLDSLVLLHSLAQSHDRLPFRLHVATFDHGWRAESAADALFVQEMAAHLNLGCTIGRMTIPDKTPLGREAAARAARYDFLAHVAHAQGAEAIVTAHHADDQIETILLHLLRGTGAHGLQGMLPYTHLPGDDTLWLMRPLLDLSREELAAYAQRHQLTPRHDVSNDDPRYQRNALRRDIVPQLKRFNPKFTQNLIRLSSIVREEQSYLNQSLEDVLLRYVEKAPQYWMIERQRIWQAHGALQKRYVWQATQTLSRTPQDVTHERITAAVTMIRERRVGAKIEIPGGVIVRLDRTHLIIEQTQAGLGSLPVTEDI